MRFLLSEDSNMMLMRSLPVTRVYIHVDSLSNIDCGTITEVSPYPRTCPNLVGATTTPLMRELAPYPDSGLG